MQVAALEDVKGRRVLRNTRLEMKMLDTIKKFIDEHGYSPTVRELAELLDIKSTSTAQRHLNTLEKEGYIDKIKFFGDFFSPLDIDELEIKLQGAKFEIETISSLLRSINIDNFMKNITTTDILELMFN